MKMKTKILILNLIMILSTSNVIGQVDSIENVIEVLELQTDLPEEIENVSEDLLERLEAVQKNRKPNLNDLSYEVAVTTLHLSDYQYYQLQLYIETYGQLYSIYELAAIDGFTEREMRRLADRTVIEPPPKERPSFRQLMRSSKSVLWFRYGQILERQAGYDTTRPNHYAGSPARLQFRYEFTVKQHFGFRIAGEKDPGEQFFRGEQKRGFDHYSGSAYIKDIRWLKLAVLGDFRLNFGQGLILGSSMLSGKGGGVTTVRRFSDGVRAIATTNESQHFRGGAFTLGNSTWSGSGFVGRVTETNNSAFGGALTYRHTRFRVSGQVICYGEFSDTANLQERWRSLGKPTLLNASLSYQATAGRLLLFGEAAIDRNAKPALLQALVYPVAPIFQLATLTRFYANGYHAPMGSGFRTASGDCGEFGTYFTGHLVLGRNVEADLFYDYYRLRWLSYRTDAPIQGTDAGIALTFRLPRRSVLLVRYQWRSRPKNESDDPYLHRIAEQDRHRLKLQWTYPALPYLNTKTEISMVFNRGPDPQQWKKGILMYQDLTFNFRRPQLSLHLRVAYFDTDSYDERLYAYENDVYYAFTIGSYYYQGLKAYLMLRYKIRNFSLWFRIARTHYLDRHEISSGLNQIDRPFKTEVRVQGMVRF